MAYRNVFLRCNLLPSPPFVLYLFFFIPAFLVYSGFFHLWRAPAHTSKRDEALPAVCDWRWQSRRSNDFPLRRCVIEIGFESFYFWSIEKFSKTETSTFDRCSSWTNVAHPALVLPATHTNCKMPAKFDKPGWAIVKFVHVTWPEPSVSPR